MRFRRFPKVGRRVAVLVLDVARNKDVFRTGRVIAEKSWCSSVKGGIRDIITKYAVRFEDNGEVAMFEAEELFTRWLPEEVKK